MCLGKAHRPESGHVRNKTLMTLQSCVFAICQWLAAPDFWLGIPAVY